MSAAMKLGKNAIVYEKRDVPGGLCDTVLDKGFRFDRTGHLLHLSDSKIKRIVFNLVGEDLRLTERRSRIFSSGVYTHYPFQANTFGLPKEKLVECLTGFIESYADRAGRRAEAATFEEFILKNFGHGIAKHFMIPYNQKLWGVHPKEITDKWCSRFVPTPDLESVVKGALAPPEKNMGYNASFYYPKRGIGALPVRMAQKASHIEYSSAPKAIDYKKKRIWVNGEWIKYRSCISSLPLDLLVKLLIEPPEKIAAKADSLRCTGLRYLDVALNRPAGTDYHWTYVPERKYPFYRVGSYSNFSKEVAPKGKGSLYVELASRSPVKLDSLMPKVSAGLIDMGLIRSLSDIAFVRPRFIERAYVVYDANHESAVNDIHPWLNQRGIFSIGRYGRWEYSAMEDAMRQGIAAADIARSN